MTEEGKNTAKRVHSFKNDESFILINYFLISPITGSQ
ncbi:hypothetical protein MTBBW1_20034 [Desulfamplus magnetovallimortis]|uniref:Uncharacterized protein n=1 Tax=Desulfamplus magnetovallimortis TaxID=1246637 RepID=A0A1W1HBH1_9BACT|nr:hypothetical protein MTBBW1_20034 [Desulfamplus magnetovallimortis]